LEKLVQKFAPQSILLRSWTLTGGVSAQVMALEIERPDSSIEKWVVRQHGAADLKHNPRIAANEYTLLQRLHAAGLAVPRPYFLDESGDLFPTPILVMEYIEGQTTSNDLHNHELNDYLGQMADHLARIHTIAGTDLPFLPQQGSTYTRMFRERPAKQDDSLEEGRIRDALEAVGPLKDHNPPVLLHGDFWPGNLLWKNSQLAAIIDWEDAAVGNPLADLGNARLEILWAYGVEAMTYFTQEYHSRTPFKARNLPYWDLCAALRPASKLSTWGLEAETEGRMRERHHLFVNQAFERLAF